MSKFLNCILFAALSGMALPANADEQKTLVLLPSSPWQLDYSADSCRLGREFGEGPDRMMFMMERYEPGDSFFTVIAGKPLGTRDNRTTDIAYGPGGKTFEDLETNGVYGDFGPSVMATTSIMAVPDGGSSKSSKADRAKEAAETDYFGQELTAAQEAQIEWLDVDARGGRPVRLMIGKMDKPLAAMRECTDELMTHWGLDLEQLRVSTRAPGPTKSPGTWINSNDYPVTALRRGQQGILLFRLIVGADGEPQSCHIQQSTRPAEFDKTVCDALMRHAKFAPALGANGQPIVSYWGTTVRFDMY